jgi:hypothetical protein
MRPLAISQGANTAIRAMRYAGFSAGHFPVTLTQFDEESCSADKNLGVTGWGHGSKCFDQVWD